MVVSHIYDAESREILTSQSKIGGTATARYSASYDASGNRTGVVELDGSRVTYAYDATYQLLSEQRSGVNAFTTSFLYDGVGNRLAQTKDGVLTTYGYDAANQMLSASAAGSVTTYSYDADGNRTMEVTA